MQQIELPLSSIEELRKLRRNLVGSTDYARVTCILMLSMGNSPSFVSSCPGIDISTVYRYRSAYLRGGVLELLENRHKGYWGLLDSRQISLLRKELRAHVYTDAKSVAVLDKERLWHPLYSARGGGFVEPHRLHLQEGHGNSLRGGCFPLGGVRA